MIIDPKERDRKERQARYLQSIACFIKDAAKHDELQRKAQELLRGINYG
jgi:hypothetical protein